MTEEAGRDDIKDFVDEVLGLLTGSRDADPEHRARLRARVQEGAERIREGVNARRDELREAVETAAVKADGYAHENPWAVAAMAAVFGLAVGILISRR